MSKRHVEQIMAQNLNDIKFTLILVFPGMKKVQDGGIGSFIIKIFHSLCVIGKFCPMI